MINQRYGRFYEIPEHLSKMGHEINLIAHNYKNFDQKTVKINNNFTITSWNLGAIPLFGFLNHYKRLVKIITISKPDVIISASDCFQIIIGSTLAKRYSIPFVADLYDNFESYGASRIPGVKKLFIKALLRSFAISAVSDKLMQFVKIKYQFPGKLFQIENAVPEKFLIVHDKKQSRKKYKFEKDKIYIGTAGKISKNNGTDLLIEAFLDILKMNSNINLVLAGPRDNGLKIPENSNIKYLGELDCDDIPIFFSALDLGIICIKNDDFGIYCFPQKFYEMVACKLPLVASNVGSMAGLLNEKKDLLFESNNKQDMLRAIMYQLEYKLILNDIVPTWKTQADIFNNIIQMTSADYRGLEL